MSEGSVREENKEKKNFIEQFIDEDLEKGKYQSVHTRFPPEPNGYLHIGHAKSICLNFGLAEKYGGKCNLRFDDTNPVKEDVEYVESIREDVRWLGFDWEDREFYASDYFGKLYDFALALVKEGKAYVDDQSVEAISEQRGTPTKPGSESPCRNRSVKENLDLFEKMKNGEFREGSHVLRGKINMSSPNMHMRDPVLYRIKFAHHHRTGNAWCIYPMYDFAHGQSDFFEGITHSICTLEFEVHRPLYDWFLDQLAGQEVSPGQEVRSQQEVRPRQIEFARLNLTYTVMSKRKLLELVQEKLVDGWDDPRMPTVSGLRRRGYTPEAIRNFADTIGVTKFDGMIDVGLLEHSIRENLNKKAVRVMAVLDPVKLVITNFPEDKVEWLETVNNPEDESMGNREIPFSREVLIEREDFMEDPPKKYFRLAPGQEVRLKSAYIIMCNGIIKDEKGDIKEIHCSYDPETKSGGAESNRKVKGTLHWVSARHAIQAEVRIYDRLFTLENPDAALDGEDFKSNLNPDSLKTITGYLEPGLRTALPGEKFQFQRLGYFCVDKDSTEEKPVFNRTVPLRDSWSRQQG